MKTPALAALAVISVSACASTKTAMVEQGYEPGSLGLAAINRADWRVAEANLNDMRGVAAGDPARLLNLGTVYMEMGRTGAALAAWRRALAAKHHYLIETADGRTLSTDQLAREALARYQTAAR